MWLLCFPGLSGKGKGSFSAFQARGSEILCFLLHRMGGGASPTTTAEGVVGRGGEPSTGILSLGEGLFRMTARVEGRRGRGGGRGGRGGRRCPLRLPASSNSSFIASFVFIASFFIPFLRICVPLASRSFFASRSPSLLCLFLVRFRFLLCEGLYITLSRWPCFLLLQEGWVLSIIFPVVGGRLAVLVSLYVCFLRKK